MLTQLFPQSLDLTNCSGDSHKLQIKDFFSETLYIVDEDF